MNKQTLVTRIVTNFPQELRELDQWVTWRIEIRNDKPTKVPYNARTGNMAESDNPSTWATFDQACAAYLGGSYDGVGYMFSEHDPYAGVDFDKCIHDHIMDTTKAQWLRGLDSYSEYSQSETGAHVIVRGKLPPGGRKSNVHSMEMYDERRFFVVTGDLIADSPATINNRQTELSVLHAMIFPPKQQAKHRGQERAFQQKPVLESDADLLQRMFSSRNGAAIQSLWNGDKSAYSDDESAADQALCNHLAFWTGNDANRIDRLFRQSGLFRDKWERNARTGETYGGGTIARAIAGTHNTYKGTLNGNHSNGSANGNTNGYHAPAQPQVDEEHEPAPLAQPAPQAKEVNALHYRAEDGGIMDAWVEHYGDDWIFVVGSDKWHFWSNTHWAEDKDLFIRYQVVDLMDRMNRQCAQAMRTAPDRIKAISAKYAKASLEIPDAAIEEIERIKTEAGIAKSMHAATKRSSARLSSVEIMSRPKRGVAVERVNIDDSLNLSNGVLSLRSLELRPHQREDLFTYCLDYEYDETAACPLFEKFISEVLVKEGATETDHELVQLFQELLGYSLTPDVRHEVMVWMFGEGSNGKSVAIGVVESLLGPMAMSIDFQSIGMPGNYDLADIPGKRVLLSTEAERGKSMAEGYIKRIVTGDTINARPIYGTPISFKSTAKIWWSMNDKPVIKDTTDSMWRRMKLIPFYRKFEEGKNADVDLPHKLAAELPGILNWAIRGLMRLTMNGRFTKSIASEDAKQQYREEANPVAQWVNTMTVRTSYPTTLQGALFREFTRWCQEQNERTITSTQFGKDLKRLRVNCERKNTGWMYNLALLADKKD